MTTYGKGDAATVEMMEEMMQKYHPELVEAEVSVSVLFAYAKKDPETDLPIGPALKHHGLQVMGLAKIIGLKERTSGMRDAQILLDGDRWPDLSCEEQEAVLDHELQHFKVQTDAKTGEVLEDALKRPKLKMRQHDWDFGLFDVVIERHGVHSCESRNVRDLFCTTGQLYFPWAKETQQPSESVAPVMSFFESIRRGPMRPPKNHLRGMDKRRGGSRA